MSTSGEPRSTPLNYVWEDGAIWFTTGGNSAKVRAFRKQPFVSFSIPSEASSPPPQAVTVRGVAEILDWNPERQLQAFMRYGTPKSEAEKMRDGYAAAMDLVSIRLEPLKVSTFGFDAP
jgi:nitroimidazol reductase NimA-like FMN-containing flavoprotein (pyridoxamine 5'-phosphate oxidase superfamily)